MKWTQRIVGSLRSSRNGRPKPGRVIVPREEDSVRDYPSVGLTPSRLAAILREADDGSLGTAMELFEEMEEKDAHLFSVANTRRLGLTGLDWQVVSTADIREDVDRGHADETAAYCREILLDLDSLDEILQHLALAIGRNISIAEIVWDVDNSELHPVDIVPVDFARIVFDEFDRWRILTEEEPQNGIAPSPNKFIAHTPHSVSGHPQRGGLLRVTAMVYLAKNLALKDWMIFAEIFGMPIRIARYDPSASVDEKRELLNMLKNMGSEAAGVFSKAVELEIIEANRGTPSPPYDRLVNFLNREMTKAWLGQTLTVDMADQSGSKAAAEVHDRVRKDILLDDIRKEGRTVRRDILRPLVQFKFGLEVPVPFFRRKPEEPRDLRELADVLSVAVNDLGIQAPTRWVHDTLGIPQATNGEATVARS